MNPNQEQAFPCDSGYAHALGMTLRDYFAIRFATTLLPMTQGELNTVDDVRGVCVSAYRWADAMLAARGKTP